MQRYCFQAKMQSVPSENTTYKHALEELGGGCLLHQIKPEQEHTNCTYHSSLRMAGKIETNNKNKHTKKPKTQENPKQTKRPSQNKKTPQKTKQQTNS